MKPFSRLALYGALLAAGAAQADIVITEVNPTGSGTAAYGADWFELTNTGSGAVNIGGWRMDDDSNAFASSVALRGVSSIAPGQSVVFIEGNASGSNDATLAASFIAAWFGGTPPAGFTIGGYGGAGVGLSATSDGVTIFDSAGTAVARVAFGASTAGFSFDNAAGLNATSLTQLSALGANGAFASVTSGEIGSPGTIGPVPEPASLALWLAGLGALGMKGGGRRAALARHCLMKLRRQRP
jgi:hypothetical protein